MIDMIGRLKNEAVVAVPPSKVQNVVFVRYPVLIAAISWNRKLGSQSGEIITRRVSCRTKKEADVQV